jgi:chromate reductase
MELKSEREAAMNAPKPRIAAIVGSLRANSVNAAVLRAVVAHAPAPVEIEPFDLSDVPLYNGDIEDLGDPASVASLKRAVAGADGLIIVTPEYNHSVPAVTKNAVDWLSRPHRTNSLVDKPVGIIAATTGRHDAAGAREHLSIAVGAITRNTFPESLGISRVRGSMDEGEIGDSNTISMLAEWLERFAAFVVATNTEADGAQLTQQRTTTRRTQHGART